MSEILGAIGDAASSVFGFIGDGIGSIISNFFYGIFYQIGTGLCWIINVLDQLFAVMSGISRVSYGGRKSYLMEVFFNNSTIGNAYWGMALIGIVLCFVFAIIAVAKKALDSGDKMRQSMGGILTSLFKGILIIISLTAVMNMVMTTSDVLLRQITYLFDNADTLDEEDSITFTDDQYAAMARVLDTIGNYSLNPSYNSRYNLNSCYNDIRADLQFLTQRGVFNFHYVTNTEKGESWQSALQKIVNAADLSQDLSLDIYNESVSNALLSCMKLLQTDYSFGPLQSYERQYTGSTASTPLDRIIFLMCTMDAAKNPAYNRNTSLRDPLRGAYYTGDKSIYNYDAVSADFRLGEIDYIVLYMVAFKLIWDLAVIIINCVARIFNMVFLYIIAPPFIAVTPLDDGGKMKQWITAFVIQCFGVFGTIIAMRVLLLFIPIVIDSQLVLFESTVLNLVAKVVLILGGMSTAKRASGVITGILADNAGTQAIMAGSMDDSVRTGMSRARGMAGGIAGSVVGTAMSGAGKLAKSVVGMFGQSKEGGSDSGGKDAEKLPEKSSEGQSPEAQRRIAGMRSLVASGQLSIGGQSVVGASQKGLQALSEITAKGGHNRRDLKKNAARLQSLVDSGDITLGQPGGRSGGWSGGWSGGASGGTAGWPGGNPGGAGQGDTSEAVPQNAPTSEDTARDEGLSWLPDGDVLTAERFTPPREDSAQGGQQDEGLSWLPDGDVLTAERFTTQSSAEHLSQSDSSINDVGRASDVSGRGSMNSSGALPSKTPPPPRPVKQGDDSPSR
ncbi:MAG: hypothetical protein MR935_01640 [Agathobaculum sp.]|uniref:Mbov_0396 family ICE element transmembrane protein n=1 Tax=Agathobaculum sp. TaxID=2048138 RepID=UPI0025C22FE3|nr:hypothetical protein [Agathobaculum sp.]MCI7124895.1 hypothetical protein [Agathobaculum sp.]